MITGNEVENSDWNVNNFWGIPSSSTAVSIERYATWNRNHQPFL